jgi:hypothetical protein
MAIRVFIGWNPSHLCLDLVPSETKQVEKGKTDAPDLDVYHALMNGLQLDDVYSETQSSYVCSTTRHHFL